MGSVAAAPAVCVGKCQFLFVLTGKQLLFELLAVFECPLC